jgi:hypothetical protein
MPHSRDVAKRMPLSKRKACARRIVEHEMRKHTDKPHDQRVAIALAAARRSCGAAAVPHRPSRR